MNTMRKYHFEQMEEQEAGHVSTLLLRQAIASLGIDQPVLRIERLKGGGLRLYLLGGEVVEWNAKTRKQTRKTRKGGQRRAKNARTPERLA